MSIQLKRAYEPAAESDGTRILVDRLWPRGISKQEAHIDHWLKEIAPSTDLRKWYHHEPEKWAEFKNRYYRELDHNPESVEQLKQLLQKGNVTFVYSAKNEDHNNAVALKEYVERQ